MAPPTLPVHPTQSLRRLKAYYYPPCCSEDQIAACCGPSRSEDQLKMPKLRLRPRWPRSKCKPKGYTLVRRPLPLWRGKRLIKDPPLRVRAPAWLKSHQLQLLRPPRRSMWQLSSISSASTRAPEEVGCRRISQRTSRCTHAE